MKAIAVLLAAAALAAATAAGGTAGSSWDGCTPRKGDVRFRAADGTRLVGHRFGSGRVAIVLAHESRGWLCEWTPFAKQLAANGYLVFAFDFRGSGESQHGVRAPSRLDLDVAAATKSVRALGAKKVFLVGASLGGSAVIEAAAEIRPGVTGLVSVSGAADLQNALPSAEKLQLPVLYLAGRLDTSFAEDAQRLYDATASTDKRILIVDRGEHGSRLVDASPQVRRSIVSFVRAR